MEWAWRDEPWLDPNWNSGWADYRNSLPYSWTLDPLRFQSPDYGNTYQAGYFRDGQWHYGAPPGFNVAGGAGAGGAAMAGGSPGAGAVASGAATVVPGAGVPGGLAGFQTAGGLGGGAAAAGGGTMSTLAPAIIQGATSAYGAAAGGKAAGEASRNSLTAAREALAFEREKEQTRKDQYSQAFKLWHTSQNALRERYGLPPLPAMEAFPASAQAAAVGTPVRAASGSPGRSGPSGVTALPMNPGSGAGVQPRTLGDIISTPDLESWNDWKAQRLA